MSVRRLVNPTDDDVHRSGASNPAAAAAVLARQGFGGRRDYGSGVVGYAVSRPRPLVRIEPRAPLAVVDGSADGLADLAAFGALPAGAPFAYAGDLAAPAVAAAAGDGGTVVVSDSNRRRVFVVSRLQQNTGWTLPAGEPYSKSCDSKMVKVSREYAGISSAQALAIH